METVNVLFDIFPLCIAFTTNQTKQGIEAYRNNWLLNQSLWLLGILLIWKWKTLGIKPKAASQWPCLPPYCGSFATRVSDLNGISVNSLRGL